MWSLTWGEPRTFAEPAFLRAHDLGVHVALHQLQRRPSEVGVDVRDAIADDGDLEVAYVGVQRAVEDALLGHLAGEDQMVDVLLPEQILQRRLVEDRVARLNDEEDVAVGLDGLDELRMSALLGQRDELLAGGVPVSVVVVDVDDVDALVPRTLYQPRDDRHGVGCAVGEGAGAVEVIGVEHVHDDQRTLAHDSHLVRRRRRPLALRIAEPSQSLLK